MRAIYPINYLSAIFSLGLPPPCHALLDKCHPRQGLSGPIFTKATTSPMATHWRCIAAPRPQDEPIDVDACADIKLIQKAGCFGGAIACPIGKPARCPQVVSEEALYMKLLAAEHSNEEPDVGAQEGSSDDFEELYFYCCFWN